MFSAFELHGGQVIAVSHVPRSWYPRRATLHGLGARGADGDGSRSFTPAQTLEPFRRTAMPK